MPRKEPPQVAKPAPPKHARPTVPPSETRTITLKGTSISYLLRVSARARRIRFVIRPGGALEVVAPRRTSVSAIEEGLRSKAQWILATSTRMAQQTPQHTAEPLATGVLLPYLGQRLRLSVQTGAPGGRYRVALTLAPTQTPQAQTSPSLLPPHNSGYAQARLDFSQPHTAPPAESNTTEGTLTLTVHTADEATIRAALVAWYRRQARAIITERLAYWNSRYGFTYHRVAIKEQKTRWGSCSRKGNLNFNWRLLLAPLPILDYVVIHELCHLKEQNHAQRFWALVAQSCPDYRERRRWLKIHGHELHF